MKNALNWFEIPVRDITRATAFYEVVLGAKLRGEEFGGYPYRVFPAEAPGVGGALVQDPKRAPGGDTLIYLNADGILDEVLARAAGIRAEVVLPKTSIGNDGFIAILRDTEGNAIGFNTGA